MYGSVNDFQQAGVTVAADSLKRKGKCCIRLLDILQLIAALCVTSYAGVAARVYLSKLGRWDGVPHFSSLYAQLVGTAIMGALVAHKVPLQLRHKIFYTALTTGLCGSMTTFSSWNYEAALSLLQLNSSSLAPLEMPDNGSRAITFVTTLLLGLSAPIGALKFGSNVANSIAPRRQSRCWTATISFCSKRWISAVSVFTGWAVLTGGVLCLTLIDRQLLFSLLLGCVGTYLRWCLSRLDKCRCAQLFPLGTFLANVSGAWIIGLTSIAIAFFSEKDTSDILLTLLGGVSTGFCGCLTTVSSFMDQLCTLPFRYACLYALFSILCAQAGLVAILVAFAWTVAID